MQLVCVTLSICVSFFGIFVCLPIAIFCQLVFKAF